MKLENKRSVRQEEIITISRRNLPSGNYKILDLISECIGILYLSFNHTIHEGSLHATDNPASRATLTTRSEPIGG